MIINKEAMLEGLRELGNVTVTEVNGVYLVRSADFEDTITVTPIYTGTTITRVAVAYYTNSYYEHDHDSREYKTLNGLVNYITKYIPLQQEELYKCKNERVVTNRFKELIEFDIACGGNDYTFIKGDIIVSSEFHDYSIRISYKNGQFKATVMTIRTGINIVLDRASSFVDLQTLLYKKGVI